MVTDLDGHITQNVVYIPYGEVFVEERNGSWASSYLFNAKELDEETGLYYYGARYLDPAGARWLSVDPMWEDYIGVSPFTYCHNNPISRIDIDGNDDFGLDETTGKLSRINVTKSKNDIVYVGSYTQDGTFKKGEKSFSVSKGILNVKDSDTDLSKSGISVPVGRQKEAVDFMVNMSFSIYREVSAWAYHTKSGEGLEIAPWDKNTFKSAVTDKYSKDRGLDSKGLRTFHVHTHPGPKTPIPDKIYGHGMPSKKDVSSHAHLAKSAKYYIISRKDGLTQYYPNNSKNRTYHGTSEKQVPFSLKKYAGYK